MSKAKQVSITKKETVTYTLNGEYGLWAKINLEYGEKSVNVMISSDYGSYQYWWSSTGSNPKEFLTEISWDYTMRKFMGYDAMYEPDEVGIEKSLKIKIIEARKEYPDTFSKDEAREAWDDMLGYFSDYGTSESMYTKLYEHDSFKKVFCDFEGFPYDTKLKPMVMHFWNNIWRPFTDELKREMEEDTEDENK